MKFTIKVWRPLNHDAAGDFASYTIDGISPDTSFLEMMDALNEQLTTEGVDPVAFDSDCREGVCGMCSICLLYTSPSPRDQRGSRMPSYA